MTVVTTSASLAPALPENGRLSTNGLTYHNVSQVRAYKPAGDEVNIMAVAVQDSGEPKVASGGKNITILLVDPSVVGDSNTAASWKEGTRLSVTWLNPDSAFFPTVKKGDVILIRRAPTQFFECSGWSQYTRLSIWPHDEYNWAVLPLASLAASPSGWQSDGVADSLFKVATGHSPPHREEKDYMLELAHWSRAQLRSSDIDELITLTTRLGVDMVAPVVHL